MEISISSISAPVQNDVKYPTYWEKMNQNENFKLVEVRKENPLFTRIEQRVKQTQPATIEKIEIVQNKNIYDFYYNSKKFIERENGNANEMELFHGTRTTQPSTIYNSLKGFDHQFSSSG
jgi:hypothetical protein